ncbi:glycerophosphodiester phosphodiesterase [Streptomyces gobiensis]|uniref:glycerophosphodiester phosphodiesterase n=1 Tax=Streptomyces gobiensis TaxID=2875706 RepID=UPI001E584204|nr:glycerophosphodiester phosphodiesterase family protein [Streptomyces gobiensis]UGY90747.1 glycerophosphodiester phosphodiesterase [Streptomyces gobiensis]
MYLRPTAVVTGSLLGVSALVLTTAPTQAAPAAKAPLPVAHRGASAYAPENTLAAADKARELGIDWVENDVQRTRDGELIVMHDDTLKRTTDVAEVFPDRAPWKVGDFTAKEIAQLDAGSWFSTKYAGERVPTLKQFLNRMTANRQKLLLEIKKPELYPGIEADIVKELSNEGWLGPFNVRRKLIIQSFGADSVKKVHDLAPTVKTGFLGTPSVDKLPDYAKFSDQVNPRYTDLTPDYVKAIQSVKGPHGKPLEVFTWTVDDGPTAVRLADMGVDGIISNKPDAIRDAIGGR